MEWSETLRTLYNWVLELANNMTNLWNWLNDSLTVGFELPFGWGYIGFTIIPLYAVVGTGLFVLLGFWLIKTFVPIA